jgi:uncharacterized protein (TIGR02145 family)
MKKFISIAAFISGYALTIPAQTVKDIDGNVYNTVVIGTQVWMQENLIVTHYRNGDSIPNVAVNAEWDTLQSGAYCNYNDNIDLRDTYGSLYNWYAINDSRKLAPSGWHIPSETEWTALFDYLGGEDEAGNKMREEDNAHWSGYCGGLYNDRATNESGFTALPGGFRITGETDEYMGDFGGFWGATEQVNEAYYFYLSTCNDYPETGYINKEMGLSVRCIADTVASKPNGIAIPHSSELTIFPNPAHDILYIRSASDLNFRIAVFNTMGECVLHREIFEGEAGVNIHFLSEGIYFIELCGSNDVKVGSFVKD